MRNCINCKDPIQEGRLKALPNAQTCVKCSTAERVVGHALITGKTTYSELQIMDVETAKRLADLQDRPGYGVSNGVKFDSDKE